MISIDKLNIFGCNTKDGLERCMNDENFYLKLVKSLMKDMQLEKLKEELINNNLDEAFKISHSLKGVYGNLAITPVYEKLRDLTEYLRFKENKNYISLVDELIVLNNEFKKLDE